ncbi:MAG: response regulator [Magnetococcales bacterium]|nr:response regulator [Magnetococcales bacterium]
MLNILLADDSPVFAKLLKRRLEHDQRYHLVHVIDERELQQTLADDYDFLLALVEFSLPEFRHGQGLQRLVNSRIPIIALVSMFHGSRGFSPLADYEIVDYVTKKSMNLDQIIDMIERMEKNTDHPILVVDALSAHRRLIARPLQLYRFPVFETQNMQEAMQVLSEHPEIRLVVTDDSLPDADGLQLLDWIRHTLKRSRDDLLVIALSGQREQAAARYFKEGANDWLAKPFQREELIYRVHQNIERYENDCAMEALASQDAVTRLANVRHFHDVGVTLYSNAARDNLAITLAVLAPDGLDSLVDNYGDYARVLTLRSIGDLLSGAFRKTDIAARLEDDAFGILIANPQPDNTGLVFSRLKRRIEAMRIPYEDDFIQVKVSIGITSRLVGSLDDMMAHARANLALARQEGKGIHLG